MIIYPVKIYKPNEHGELEYVKTIYPNQLSEIHWVRFNQETGQLNLRSNYKYTRVDSSYDDTQMEE
tara:strand:- start:270 stop:467 length:198 start_codon:yes stop_codon:yes gene_type:complete